MVTKYQFKTALVLAPHTDDGELGCGGTIAKLIEDGCRVVYVAFSAAETIIPKSLPRDILRVEVKQAMKKLGVLTEDLLIYDYEVRCFQEHRQSILDNMIKLREQFSPDLVFLPSINDTHQDHAVITQEGFRAFKMTTIFGYEMPWNNLTFKASSFFVLHEQHLQRKVQALLCYKSQSHRSYVSPDFITSLALVRGTQIGKKYAEAFDLIRCVLN